jgi:hypothetical protein
MITPCEGKDDVLIIIYIYIYIEGVEAKLHTLLTPPPRKVEISDHLQESTALPPASIGWTSKSNDGDPPLTRHFRLRITEIRQ